MSVSNESMKGDRIFVIEPFIADIVLDNDGKVLIDKSKHFNIGDCVLYCDWSYLSIGENIYTKIKFMTNENKMYSAVESFFVTEDTWKNITKYFESQFKR